MKMIQLEEILMGGDASAAADLSASAIPIHLLISFSTFGRLRKLNRVVSLKLRRLFVMIVY